MIKELGKIKKAFIFLTEQNSCKEIWSFKELQGRKTYGENFLQKDVVKKSKQEIKRFGEFPKSFWHIMMKSSIRTRDNTLLFWKFIFSYC